MSAIADVLNVIESTYTQSETYFGHATNHGGAATLLYVLDDGLRAKAKRRERLERGEILGEDYPRHL